MKKKVKRTEYDAYITYKEARSGGEVCEGDEGSDFPDREDAYIDFELQSLAASPGKNNWHHTFTSLRNPKEFVGVEVYLVIVRYTDGDTFGQCHGYWQVIDFFAHKEQAEKVAEIIPRTRTRNYYDNERERKRVEKESKAAIEEMHKLTPISYCTWNGYFSTFEKVEIHKITMRAALPS